MRVVNVGGGRRPQAIEVDVAVAYDFLLGPIIAYFVTKRVCLALQKKDREIVLHGYESGRIVKLPGGEFMGVEYFTLVKGERGEVSGPHKWESDLFSNVVGR